MRFAPSSPLPPAALRGGCRRQWWAQITSLSTLRYSFTKAWRAKIQTRPSRKNQKNTTLLGIDFCETIILEPRPHALKWLTQEADAKSWSSLKHVQPKEGRKELAPREIKFRYRRLDTTIRERAGSSQVPREAQESQRYPGLLLFGSFFS